MAPTKRGLAKKAGLTAGQTGSSSAPTGKKKFTKADWSESVKTKTAGVTDMTLLSTISNESVNENLKVRFQNAEIYTYIGHVLISVNPFRLLPIYDDQTLRSYRGKNRLEVPPHVYSIAETMYYNMTSYHENQCVIISGESGAGKTEAAKRIMQYIASVAGDVDSGIQGIKEMVLATNPLLESFGCAKTLRNNNSSRHGKYLELEFDSKGAPVGAMITNYLLEKGRVVGQIQNERNFHIFYQLSKGATAEQRESLGIQDPSSYTYISQSKCLDVDGIDDVQDYTETLKAMDTIGIGKDEQSSILRQLAAILWLGNIQFATDQEGNAYISDESVPAFVAYLLEVDAQTVSKSLTSRVIETARGGRRGSVYEVPLNPAQAKSTRDALAKAIYNNLFEWIVERINRSMKSKAGAAQHVIGILDIYGFEIFENNSFEQLCINYVNEKLQQIFIELTLKREQEEYTREQIKWTPIDFFNNKVVCDLIEEKRPPGLFAALNDACATAHADPTAADSSFSQRLGQLSSNKHFESRNGKFVIKHYAGDVTYDVPGMTDKNKDILSRDLWDLIGSSSNQFLQQLFPDRPDPNSKKRPITASDRIKHSANALVEKLMRSEPSYIRTIKPNSNRSPSEYDTKAILHQIQYLGLRENIRVRRAGFAYRNTFDKMVERFYLLSRSTSYAGDFIWKGDAKSGCEQILIDAGVSRDEWQMGLTKAFIKNPETLFALEHARDRYWHTMAARIQRWWRSIMRERREAANRIERFWKNKKENIKYVELRDQGHQILAGRKERRRFSLISMRQFRGDYLGVQGQEPQGELLRNIAGITSADTVLFSSTGKILISKLGRSSKPFQRYLILTRSALHILAAENVQGKVQTVLERKIPMTTIRGIGMSTLRDDWMSINVTSGEDDPFLWCLLKTELVTALVQQTGGSIQVNISNPLEYAKKKDKRTKVTFIKDDTVRKDDVYKSQKVTVSSGEPANSVSDPPAPRKKSASSHTLTTSTRPAAPRPQATSRTHAKTAVKSQPVQQSNPAATRPPPPPPPPPAARGPDMYKALYPFPGGNNGEMDLIEGELVEVTQKTDNGWWLVKKNGQEGWAPENYLEKTASKPPPANGTSKPTIKPKPKLR